MSADLYGFTDESPESQIGEELEAFAEKAELPFETLEPDGPKYPRVFSIWGLSSSQLYEALAISHKRGGDSTVEYSLQIQVAASEALALEQRPKILILSGNRSLAKYLACEESGKVRVIHARNFEDAYAAIQEHPDVALIVTQCALNGCTWLNDTVEAFRDELGVKTNVLALVHSSECAERIKKAGATWVQYLDDGLRTIMHRLERPQQL